MSGSQGAFLNALDPLSGMTNPFEFSNQVSQARKNALDVENLQGQKVWGQSLLKNTDANGNVDYQGAARDAAAAGGPAAAMAARSALGDMATQRTQQINNAAGMYKTVGIGAMGLAKDPSDANVNAVFDNMAASGLPAAQVNAERQRVLAMTNPADRQNYAMQHGLSALEQMHQVIGQTTLRDVGGVAAPVTLNQPSVGAPGGSATVGGGGVSLSLTPDQAAQPVTYTDKNNVAQHTTLGEYQKIVGVPPQPGGQQVPGALGAVPSATPAGVPPAGTIPPNPNVPTGTPGGRIVPPPGLANPNRPALTPAPTAPAATSVPAVTPPVVTVPQPETGKSIPGPAPGAVPAAQRTAEQSAALGTTLTTRADQVPTNKANYANMLTDLDRLGNMPPGGEREVAINTFLQKATGYGFTMTPDQIAGANSFAKLANIAVGQQLQAIGGTDARQALFMGSNPNLDLSKLGNTQIIHMLQGNEDAIQAKSRAWQAWQKAGNGTETYPQFQDDFNHHFDPRVFQQQYMGQSEIAALKKSMADQPGATAKFLGDVKYARDQGWIQ